MHNEDLCSEKLITYPVVKGQRINVQNP